jgi:hypothetical protein
MAVTSFEKGVQAGLQQAATTFEKGVQHGRRMTLPKVLEARFGPLSPRTQERLQGLSAEQLKALTPEVLKARSHQELGLED